MQQFPVISTCGFPFYSSTTASSVPAFVSNIVPLDGVQMLSDDCSQMTKMMDMGVPLMQYPPFLHMSAVPTSDGVADNSKFASDERICGNSSLSVSNGSQIVTIRMLMSGKEVGSIIGKRGDNVKRIREQSGARINISDGSCPERIVTVTGTVEKVYSSFLMMCQKFENDNKGDIQNGKADNVAPCPPVTLRLLVPATQCGSIIGKGGCKIKDIREMCGASIQVASELLPNSSERSVTVSGTAVAVASCIRRIAIILIETPLRYETIPYVPKPSYTTLPTSIPQTAGVPPIFAFPSSVHPDILNTSGVYSPKGINPIPFYPIPPAIQSPLYSPNIIPAFVSDSLNFNGLPTQMSVWTKSTPSLPSSCISECQTPTSSIQSGSSQVIKELHLSNELIGCIIGRGGATINEIRSISGAQIKISDNEEGSTNRRIIISGSVESVSTAQLLISANIQSYQKSLAISKGPDSESSNQTVTLTTIQTPPIYSTSGYTPYSRTTLELTSVNNKMSGHCVKLRSSNFLLNADKRSHKSFYSPY